MNGRMKRHSGTESVQSLRNDSVGEKYLEGDDLQRGLVRGFQHYGTRSAGALHLQPSRRTHAPAIARLEPRETELRHGRREVIAQARGHGEKFLRDNAADGVQTEIVRAGVAAAIAKKAGHWLASAGFQRLPEDVFLRSGLCGRHTQIVVEKRNCLQ